MSDTVSVLPAAATQQADTNLGAKIDAVAGSVAALASRVTVLETGKPPPPPPPPPILVESLNGTTITKPGDPPLVVKGVVWRLVDTGPTTGLKIQRNDTLLVETSLVDIGLRYNDAFYQRNTFGSWYAADAAGLWTPVAGDPRVAPPLPPVDAVGPPAQARIAGFITPAMMSEFVNKSEVADWSQAVPSLWYTGTPETRLIGANDYSIANSTISLPTGGSWAANISTARGTGAAVSRPGKIVAPNAEGRVFQYGYFEACIQFDDTRGNQWPSFWATSYNNAPGDHLEMDFVECPGRMADGGISAGWIDWFDGVNDPGAYGQMYGSLGCTGYPPSWLDMVKKAGLDTSGGWNIFGCCWTPTRMEWWWTSLARRKAGVPDTLICTYPTDRAINGFVNNDFNRPVTRSIGEAANNGNALFAILGAAANCNYKADYVRIWQ